MPVSRNTGPAMATAGNRLMTPKAIDDGTRRR